jgi:hypothetical protein
MSSDFDIFDYPYPIELVTVTDGYYAEYNPHHPSSGQWMPVRGETEAITGNIAPVTERELQYLPEAVKQSGARKISVDSDIVIHIGDQLRITEYDGSQTTWKVEKEIGTSNLFDMIGINRRQYYISLVL